MPNKSTSDASPFATKSSTPSGFSGLGSGFSAFGSSFPAPSGKLTSFASPNAPAAFSGSAGKLTSFASPNAPAAFSGSAGKLTSFASPNAPVSLAESSNKTLRAEQSDDEEDEDGPVGEPDDTFVAEKTDERFHTQTGMDPALLHSPWTPNMARDSYRSENSVETGEENETTEFTAKGKLYGFDDKKWKERGAGTFKVNLKTESDGKKSGRIIMRADGALRVMLNSAIWQTMPFGDIKGSRPTTRDIYLASKEDEKVVSLLLRVSFQVLNFSGLTIMLTNQFSSVMRSRPRNFMMSLRTSWTKSSSFSRAGHGFVNEGEKKKRKGKKKGRERQRGRERERTPLVGTQCSYCSFSAPGLFNTLV
ncbi:MAG: hypothetical protein LBE43_00180 [Staphylococcus aureus]|jgi:Ran-binding protein 3|nr:hypothetical protein [Staphylococcus aureus]